MSVVLFLIFIPIVAALEFEGADQNSLQNMKLQYEELLTRLHNLKKDHDADSEELSLQMETRMSELEDAVKRFDRLQSYKALVERWIERHRRAHEMRYASENDNAA